MTFGRKLTVLALLAAGFGAAAPAPPQSLAIRWEKRGTAHIVSVTGIDSESLRAIDAESLRRVLAVYTPNATIPITGTHRITDAGIEFLSAFPLQPGIRYRAVFRPSEVAGIQVDSAPVTSIFEIPRIRIPSATVKEVYPTASVLPENLLKFYIHFSAPMSRGGIYDHISLLKQNGKPVDLPFLELGEELWNPEMTRLTLFIDPGRIKRGVKPLEDIGPALEAGKRFTLVVRRTAHDAKGNPLKSDYQKPFKVGPPDRTPIPPKRWKIHPPRAGTRNPLTVDLDGPIDHALAHRLIGIRRAGKTITGRPSLTNHESRWSFTPDSAWATGKYDLVIATTLEDLAGNNIGKPFEVDIFRPIQRSLTSAFVRLPWWIR